MAAYPRASMIEAILHSTGSPLLSRSELEIALHCYLPVPPMNLPRAWQACPLRAVHQLVYTSSARMLLNSMAGLFP